MTKELTQTEEIVKSESIIFNLSVARNLGIYAAILLGEVLNKQSTYGEDEYVSITRGKIQADTGLTLYQQREGHKALVNAGLLDVKKDEQTGNIYYRLRKGDIYGLQ